MQRVAAVATARMQSWMGWKVMTRWSGGTWVAGYQRVGGQAWAQRNDCGRRRRTSSRCFSRRPRAS